MTNNNEQMAALREAIEKRIDTLLRDVECGGSGYNPIHEIMQLITTTQAEAVEQARFEQSLLSLTPSEHFQRAVREARIDELRLLANREPSMWNLAGIIDRGDHDYRKLWWEYQKKAMSQSGYYRDRIAQLTNTKDAK